MKSEIRVFFTALMFYTRIPCPKWVDHHPGYLNQSIRYFPLIGWLVGAVAFIGFLLGSWSVSPLFGIVLSFMASVLITGAFHEDGFADVCDGFGGGWTKEKILLIMKDSRIGAYGVVGLVLNYLIKGSLLLETLALIEGSMAVLLFVSAHAVSRFMASTFVFTHDYVRDSDDSKAKPVAKQTGKVNLVLSAIFGLLPLSIMSVLIENYTLLMIIPFLYLVKIWLGSYFTRWIGGYTGDCLGAVQQVTEVVFYLLLLLVWKFTS